MLQTDDLIAVDLRWLIQASHFNIKTLICSRVHACFIKCWQSLAIILTLVICVFVCVFDHTHSNLGNMCNVCVFDHTHCMKAYESDLIYRVYYWTQAYHIRSYIATV